VNLHEHRITGPNTPRAGVGLPAPGSELPANLDPSEIRGVGGEGRIEDFIACPEEVAKGTRLSLICCQ
jgi:hypothetical protein